MRQSARVLMVGAALGALVGCAAGPTSTAGPSADTPATTSAVALCTPDEVAVQHPGTLVVGTVVRREPPWFDGDPTTGKGYESALTYAVAAKLGFDHAAVSWERVEFPAALRTGPKSYDVYVGQMTLTEERRAQLDFSTPYLDIDQVVITRRDTEIAAASTVEELRGARIGATAKSTNMSAIEELIDPETRPSGYPDPVSAAAALAAKKIDAMVADTAVALYLAGVKYRDFVVLGRLPARAGQEPATYAMSLPKGSELTRCVSAALDALEDDGTLADLQRDWVYGSGIPDELG